MLVLQAKILVLGLGLGSQVLVNITGGMAATVL